MEFGFVIISLILFIFVCYGICKLHVLCDKEPRTILLSLFLYIIIIITACVVLLKIYGIF